MSLPTIFLHNIDVICPLLGSNESLHSTLVPSRFSSRIYAKNTFWGRFYTVIHPAPADELSNVLKSTMLIFFRSIQRMVVTQEVYLRILKELINGVHSSTEDLENCRSELKHLYDGLSPMIKKLKRADTVPANELLSILHGFSREDTTVAGRFSMEYLNQKNKRIAALIHLECLYGALLPYGQLMSGIYTDEIAPTERARSIISTVCFSVDFKISHLALYLLYSLISSPLPKFSEIYYLLSKKNIKLIEIPETKHETFRQSLRPGMKIAVADYATITLGEPISYTKKSSFNLPAYSIEEWPNKMIVFQPNRMYHAFYKKVIERDSRAVQPSRTFVVDDRKGYWSIEERFIKKILPLSKFLVFICYLLEHGPLCAIEFSELSYKMERWSKNGKMIPQLPTPITESADDYEGFLSSLIKFYEASPYSKDIPSLYQFLEICLEPAKKEYKNFFSELAADVVSLPLSFRDSELNLQISTAIGKKKTICSSKKQEDDERDRSFRKKCQTLAQEILEIRDTFLSQFRSLETFQKDEMTLLSHEYREEEARFLENFKTVFPPMVQSWILPPPELQKKLFERLLQKPSEKCFPASST